MDNPWEKVDGNIAECDKDILGQGKLKPPKNPLYTLNFNLLPVPFIGNKDAPILYLTLNPGDIDRDIYYQYKNINDLNLQHDESSNLFCLKFPYDCPSGFPSDPEPNKPSPAFDWWYLKLKVLIDNKDIGIDKVAKNIFVIEYIAYHSKQYGNLKKRLKSQEYSFWLVKEAMKRDALIIISRSIELWYNAVKGLEDYSNKVILINKRQPYVTKNNCCPQNKFDDIVKILKEAK
jgi:hypothetical protein